MPGTRTPRRSYASTIPIEHGRLSRNASSSANGLLVFGTRFADVIKTDSSVTGTHHGSLSPVQVSDSRFDGAVRTSRCRTESDGSPAFRRRGTIYLRG